MRWVHFLTAILCCLTSIEITASTLSIPLSLETGWEVLRYSRIKQNRVRFDNEGLTIEVDNSAGPVIYPLDEASRIQAVSFSLEISGDINLGNMIQGDKGADDFVFRLGLVYEGDQTLNFLQRRFSAPWVQRLFHLAPKGTGVDLIEFYNVYSDSRLAGKSRSHPLSDLLHESFIFAQPRDGKLTRRLDLNKSTRVLALWISVDGDDTGSRFTTRITDLKLHLPE